MRKLALFLFGVIAAISSHGQFFQKVYLANNTDSTGIADIGIIRHDPATGKYRFWDSVGEDWFSFPTSGGSSISFGGGFQIPYSNGTDDFNYSSNFVFIPATGLNVSANFHTLTGNSLSSTSTFHCNGPLSLRGGDATTDSYVFLDETGASIGNAAQNVFFIAHSLNGLLIRDQRASPVGLRYDDSDYVKDPRSLTTKEYVDSVMITERIEISSAQILSAFSGPTELIAGTGFESGKFIEVHALNVIFHYGTTPYAGNTDLIFSYDALGPAINGEPWDVSGTSDEWVRFSIGGGSGYNIFEVEGTGIYLTTNGTNPTSGDSTATLIITYRIASIE